MFWFDTEMNKQLPMAEKKTFRKNKITENLDFRSLY